MQRAAMKFMVSLRNFSYEEEKDQVKYSDTGRVRKKRRDMIMMYNCMARMDEIDRNEQHIKRSQL